MQQTYEKRILGHEREHEQLVKRLLWVQERRLKEMERMNNQEMETEERSSAESEEEEESSSSGEEINKYLQ